MMRVRNASTYTVTSGSSGMNSRGQAVMERAVSIRLYPDSPPKWTCLPTERMQAQIRRRQPSAEALQSRRLVTNITKQGCLLSGIAFRHQSRIMQSGSTKESSPTLIQSAGGRLACLRPPSARPTKIIDQQGRLEAHYVPSNFSRNDCDARASALVAPRSLTDLGRRFRNRLRESVERLPRTPAVRR